MHPYLIELYIKALQSQSERSAEHERLVAMVNRSRRQHPPTKTKRPRWPIRVMYLRKSRSRDETPSRPTLEMKSQH
jgi:hypothetical protein